MGLPASRTRELSRLPLMDRILSTKDRQGYAALSAKLPVDGFAQAPKPFRLRAESLCRLYPPESSVIAG